MRLVCPNCDAEYEVDDAAIPRDGRDVQCSNCGHAWFQAHPEIEAEAEAEADLYEAPAGVVAEEAEAATPLELDEDDEVHEPAAAVSVAETVAEVPPVEQAAAVEGVAEVEQAAAVLDSAPLVEAPAVEDVAEVAPVTAVEEEAAVEQVRPRTRTLDETVLAVLREEAEREAASRRAEAAPAPVIESQTEMPLAAPQDQGGMAAAVRRIARMRAEAAETVEAEVEPEPAPKTRGQMFPAIEEINSTLRATGDRGQDEGDTMVDTLPDLTAPRGRFRRGFMTLVVLALLIVALYLAAPMIGERIPALAGAAKTYVAVVDAARVWLDVNLRALVATLRGLAGGAGG